MNSHLKQFVAQYLTIVFATFMSVSFFAFLAIPYNLGTTPGEETTSQMASPVPVTAQKSETSTLKLKA